MLRIDTSPALLQAPKIKCAEVFCQNEVHFSIVCVLCDMKLFEFADFLLHFHNIHLSEDARIKTEQMDELNGLDESECNNDDAEQMMITGLEPLKIEIVTTPMAQTEFLQKSDSMDGTDTSDDDNAGDDDWKANSDSESDCIEYEEETRTVNSRNMSMNSKIEKPPAKCEQCHKVYKSSRYLETHMKLKHSTAIALHECDHCDRKFTKKAALEMHVKKHTGYACPDCNKVYKSKAMLTDHAYKHTGIKQFHCKETGCNKAFYYPKQLVNHHRQVHSSFWKYVCETCGQRFKMHSTMLVHMRSHTGERPFKCKVCEKGFASSSLLAEHMPIHSSERPHKCDVCGRAFARPKTLYHHKHLHLDVKKFVCKICGKAYAQAAGLCGHMKQHKTD